MRSFDDGITLTQMTPQAQPEILRLSLADSVLHVSQHVDVSNQPFHQILLQLKVLCPESNPVDILSSALDAPSKQSIDHAHQCLVALGAIDREKHDLTPLGAWRQRGLIMA